MVADDNMKHVSNDETMVIVGLSVPHRHQVS